MPRYLAALHELKTAAASSQSRGISLEKVPVNIATGASQIINRKLGYFYPPIASPTVAANFLPEKNFEASARNNATNDASGICSDCHFNNCNECGPAAGGGDPTIDTEQGTGPQQGYSCRANAAARRQNAVDQAHSAAIVALFACGGSG